MYSFEYYLHCKSYVNYYYKYLHLTPHTIYYKIVNKFLVNKFLVKAFHSEGS